MTNTFFLGPEETKKAILHYLYDVNGIELPNWDNFLIGFLDKDEKNTEVGLIQLFYEIE